MVIGTTSGWGDVPTMVPATTGAESMAVAWITWPGLSARYR